MAKAKTQNPIEKLLAKIDRLQQRTRAIGFPFAVIKKYGDDTAGHQAALITYYGFLSLFPLLLVATSIIDIITVHNDVLRDKLIINTTQYLPVIGAQLQSSINTNTKTGVALAIGIIVTLYGARGIADAVRSSLDHAWAIPKAKRTGFPRNIIKSFGLLLGAGLGLVITTTLTGYAAAVLGHGLLVRAIPLAVNLGLLYLVFMYVFLIGTSRRLKRKDLRLGAITSAAGLLLLQFVGVMLIKHQITNLQGLYGQFAIVLALMFWIYLQAQVFMYAIEINVVHAYKLWPRSLTGTPLTVADRRAYRLYAKKEAYRPQPEEEIAVRFQR